MGVADVENSGLTCEARKLLVGNMGRGIGDVWRRSGSEHRGLRVEEGWEQAWGRATVGRS